MIDLPDARKVHARAIPRVGGIGIVVGSLVSVWLWVPQQPWLASYIFGSLLLLGFGAADDSLELGHYVKFVGQFMAAIAVVYFGDVWVSQVPLLDHALSPVVGRMFTVFALVGVMNALNHSDGLDGLAGGESLLTLGAIGYLAYSAQGDALVIVVCAVAGGVFGFLRFNTHPAQVFMGDAGSQFLGFSLGLLVVLLTQQADRNLSMALPALLLGLPIIDILVVFYLRASSGMNWFRATRNHVHHRLLDRGFSHHQVVVIIYSLQALMVGSALIASYESDLAIVAIYAAICCALFLALRLSELMDWRWRREPSAAASQSSETVARVFGRLPLAYVQWTLPLYLLVASVAATRVPSEFRFLGLGILALSVASLAVRSRDLRRTLTRLALYGGSACIVFVMQTHGGTSAGIWPRLDAIYLSSLALAVVLAMRIQTGRGFQTTPLDFLLVLGVLICGTLLAHGLDESLLAGMAVRVAVLFYAVELTIGCAPPRLHASELSLLGSVLVLLGKAVSLS